MAKTIKFNLICDNNPIRTLEDLKNNFSIEDVLEYYHNKLLYRWLSVRGYFEELEKVTAIQEEDDLSIIKALIQIFAVEVEPATIEENTYILGYKKKRELCFSQYKQQEFRIATILVEHHIEYQNLISTIIQNNSDMAIIKAAIKEIDENYHDLYKLDFRRLLYELHKNAPMAIFAMLMRDSMRVNYLPTEEEPNRTKMNPDKRAMYDTICKLLASDFELGEILGSNLKQFSGTTNAYWKDIEPKGKVYMILKMESGNFVRASGENGGDIGVHGILNSFITIDGIDYESNNADHKLLYMEV